MGTVALQSRISISSGATGHRSKTRKAAVLILASGSLTVVGGQVKTVTLHLSAKARLLPTRTHVLRVRATIAAHDPAGATHTAQTIVTLRAPNEPRRKTAGSAR
jgi:hypothetical protein